MGRRPPATAAPPCQPRSLAIGSFANGSLIDLEVADLDKNSSSSYPTPKNRPSCSCLAAVDREVGAGDAERRAGFVHHEVVAVQLQLPAFEFVHQEDGAAWLLRRRAGAFVELCDVPRLAQIRAQGADDLARFLDADALDVDRLLAGGERMLALVRRGLGGGGRGGRAGKGDQPEEGEGSKGSGESDSLEGDGVAVHAGELTSVLQRSARRRRVTASSGQPCSCFFFPAFSTKTLTLWCSTTGG